MRPILILFLAMLSFHSFAQETKPVSLNMMVLYPEVYQVIELEQCENAVLADLINFCEEQELTLILEDQQMKLFKIYPSFLGVEKATLDLEEKIAHQIGLHAKVKSIKSYGREYLPEEYHPLISNP
ncbi:hypothetical protein MM236_10800 [Belliella sp. DSM 107340]|uniref:Uncharacterized protein n=1 Tax=Belliella calami TaxID=2923436 RepID=A0ABS9UPD2_9BACT|nr:hypothetical protein [Belliella calami]MCH7398482.1 hypothetical protein [Belliella calami]